MEATQPTQRRFATDTLTIALVVLLLLCASAAVSACGGTSTTASPSAAPSVTARSPSATPSPTASGRGTIAFTRQSKRSQDIYVMRSDGTGLRRLAKDAQGPAWSPDGSRIAYTKGGDVHVMNADGSGQRLVTRALAAGWAAMVAWSPGGTRIVFSEGGDLLVVNTDGSGLRYVSAASSRVSGYHPAWAPSGRILFGRGSSNLYEICSVDPDARRSRVATVTKTPPISSSFSLSRDGSWLAISQSDADRLLRMPADGPGAAVVLLDEVSRYLARGASVLTSWSPDGSEIALGNDSQGWRVVGVTSSLYIATADGSHVWKVPNTAGAYDPAWRPE